MLLIYLNTRLASNRFVVRSTSDNNEIWIKMIKLNQTCNNWFSIILYYSQSFCWSRRCQIISLVQTDFTAWGLLAFRIISFLSSTIIRHRAEQVQGCWTKAWVFVLLQGIIIMYNSTFMYCLLPTSDSLLDGGFPV